MKIVIDALNEVVEPLQGEYELKDGKYYLKLEGELPGAKELVENKGKVIEFRDRNIKLLKEIAEMAGVEKTETLEPLKDLLAKNKIDLEGHQKIKEELTQVKSKLTEIEKKGIKKPDDVTTIVQEQVKAIVSEQVKTAVDPLREELKVEKAARESEKTARIKAQSRADKALFRETIGGKASKLGAKPKTLDFLISQAETSFHVKEEKVVALDTKFSTTKPSEPLEVDEWLTQAVKDYDFAFEASKGGDTQPKVIGGNSPPRPGVKTLVNPSPQELGKHSKAIAKGEMIIVNQ